MTNDQMIEALWSMNDSSMKAMEAIEAKERAKAITYVLDVMRHCQTALDGMIPIPGSREVAKIGQHIIDVHQDALTALMLGGFDAAKQTIEAFHVE